MVDFPEFGFPERAILIRFTIPPYQSATSRILAVSGRPANGVKTNLLLV
jgi:hypothetical protein